MTLVAFFFTKKNNFWYLQPHVSHVSLASDVQKQSKCSQSKQASTDWYIDTNHQCDVALPQQVAKIADIEPSPADRSVRNKSINQQV